jgi:hypothetical protein
MGLGSVLRSRCALVIVVAACAVSGAVASSAQAQAPWWHLTTRSVPTDLKPGGEGKVIVVADNVGDGSAHGPVTVSDRLAPGVTATAVSLFASFFVLGGDFDLGPSGAFGSLNICKVTAVEVVCTFPGVEELEKAFPVATAEQFSPPVPPYSGRLEMVTTVQVAQNAGSEVEDDASVTGSGAPPVEVAKSTRVGSTSTAFGVAEFTQAPEDEGGTVDAQGGSHPFQMTTDLAFNQTAEAPYQPAQPKDVRIAMPPGLVGNPTVVAQCPYSQFTLLAASGSNLCPAQTAIGAVMVTLVQKASKATFATPLFNLVPAAGEPARFGFDVQAVPVTLDASVRTGDDYGVTLTSSNLSQLDGILAAQVTIWGTPGDRRHDASRGWGCLDSIGACGSSSSARPIPFLALPTSCSAAFQSSVEADSWTLPGRFSEPDVYTLRDSTNPTIRMDGCDSLPFDPEISVVPDSPQASTPSGLTVDVHMPQDAESHPDGLVQSMLQGTTLVLPAGVAVNPGGTDGLEACTEAEIGYLEPLGTPPDDLHFSSGLPSPFCPDGAKIGTAEVDTPLLANRLEGSVYLASQNANPFGALLAMYVVVEDPVSGTLLKLPGEVSLDASTGQMTATFKNTPQLPFEDLRLHFFDGPRAPLGTPSLCGAYAADGSFAPWSGRGPVSASSTFEVTSGPKGSPCPGSTPFTPTLVAGMTNAQAGGFSPLTMTLSREDGNQDLQSVQLHMPPGVSAIVSSVAPCDEDRANAGTCDSASLIGHTIVSVGLGGDPYNVTGGEVFLTGPYDGAPYGLSIVIAAKAGPFDLGTVVVRAKIEVDPTTGVLTVTTDPSGPHAIPHILDGIPLQVKHVNVTVDRPGFTFNPTSCDRLAIRGSATSDQGASVPLSAPFQVANCASLGFKPRFEVSVSGKTSRKNGASVNVKVAYQKGPFGSQANVAKVKVVLPKQLPSRLTTLQKACPDHVFNANPDACPRDSRVGEAIAKTPILSSRLRGPAYFVSHGGTQFPELVIVLHGGGITVDLHGETFISKAGITSSTFPSIPDLPIGMFELKLPAGPDSALAANANLCNGKLVMPVTFTAQSGVETHQSTMVDVTGCEPAVTVVSHRVDGQSASILVKVPGAGRLTAAGEGLSGQVKSVKKAGRVTVELRLTSREQRFLARHPSRKLEARVSLRFKPSHGRSISTSTTVLLA